MDRKQKRKRSLSLRKHQLNAMWNPGSDPETEKQILLEKLFKSESSLQLTALN